MLPTFSRPAAFARLRKIRVTSCGLDAGHIQFAGLFTRVAARGFRAPNQLLPFHRPVQILRRARQARGYIRQADGVEITIHGGELSPLIDRRRHERFKLVDGGGQGRRAGGFAPSQLLCPVRPYCLDRRWRASGRKIPDQVTSRSNTATDAVWMSCDRRHRGQLLQGIDAPKGKGGWLGHGLASGGAQGSADNS